MFKRALIVLTLLALLASLMIAMGYFIAQRQRASFIDRHIAGPTERTGIDLRPQVYAGLPTPVRRYFDFAFNGRTEIAVHWVDWTERGEFLLPVGQFRVRGRQASRANQPVYTWTGTFWRFGFPLLESRDAFFVTGHDMRAKLFGWINVMHTAYEKADQIASLHSYLVLRYYGQAPMMPWALLPNKFVQWEPRDEKSAYIAITHERLEGRYRVTFGEDGRIIRMETDRLLMEGNYTMQREVGRKLVYKEVGGFWIPTPMDYRWYLEDGTLSAHYDFELADLRILE
ncbi:MAG: DUF6544 family protein [Geminicoccaceae bacterium]